MNDLDPVLADALRQSTSPTCVTTADLTAPGPEIVFVNDAYCVMMAASREAVIGRSPRIMQGPLTDRGVLDRLRDQLSQGESFVGETFNYRIDGHPFINLWRIDPVRSSAGEISHYAATQQDVTELRSFEALADAYREIDLASQEAIGATREPKASLRLMVEGIARAFRPMMYHLGDVGVTVRHPFGDDVRCGATDADGQLYPFVSSNSAISGAVEVVLSSEELKIVDQDMLDVVIRRSSIALDALLTALIDRQVVQEFEMQLGGGAPLDIGGFEVVSRYVPSFDTIDIAGDWLDVIDSGGRPTFLVGDVSGHGVEAAVAMTRLRSAVEVILGRRPSLHDGLAEINAFAVSHSIFATLLIVRPNGAAFEMATAGHVPPVMIGLAGVEKVDLPPGPILGSFSDSTYHVVNVPSERISILGLFTDGLVEHRGESIDIGFERLEAVMASEESSLARLADRIMALSRDQSLRDDSALMLIGVPSAVAERRGQEHT